MQKYSGFLVHLKKRFGTNKSTFQKDNSIKNVHPRFF